MVWVLVVFLYSVGDPNPVGVQRVGEYATRQVCEEKRRAYADMIEADPSPSDFYFESKCVERETLPTS